MFDRMLQPQPIYLSFTTLKVLSLVADVVFFNSRRILHSWVTDDTLNDQIWPILAGLTNSARV